MVADDRASAFWKSSKACAAEPVASSSATMNNAADTIFIHPTSTASFPAASQSSASNVTHLQTTICIKRFTMHPTLPLQ